MYSPRRSENHFATHHEFTCWAKIRQSYIMTNQSFFSRTSQTSNTVKLGDKEQISVKELFTDYQPFYTINLLLDKELLPI